MSRVLSVGEVIAGRFEVERHVARGGMGMVHRALDRASGAPVALKIIALPREDAEAPSRFEREAAMLQRAAHPRIVRYIASGPLDDGYAYLAMQWLEGEDLRTVLRRGALPAIDARNILECVAEALSAVHAEGIVHRDLKPANLLLRGRSSADTVLLDFGIARPMEGSKRLTVTGTLVGTPQYMAPEQLVEGGKVRPATDVFALGCIFYECLTGRPAFDAAHIVGVLARILYDEPTPLHSVRPDIPPAWDELLGRMLSRDPERRPRDGAALRNLVASLHDFVEEGPRPGPLGMSQAREETAEQTLVSLILVTFDSSQGQDLGALWEAEAAHVEAARKALGRNGFNVEALADGSIVAAVSSGAMATDQARIAARGALYLRDVWPEARIAVVTGRALMGRTTRMGDAVYRALELLESRAGNSHEGIWLDPVSAGLLDTRFVTQEIEGATLLFAEQPDEGVGRLLLGKPTPCVGREVELLELEGLLGGALLDRQPQGLLVVGPPGSGKSRLFAEFTRRFGKTHTKTCLLVGRGDPLTAGSPYGLLRDALRRHAGLDWEQPEMARRTLRTCVCEHVDGASRRRVSEFLGEMCGIPFPEAESPLLLAARSDAQVMEQQIAQAFLDWITAECASRPVVLVLEDLQWGDALTVKLVRSVLRDGGEIPLFVLALGRPETRDLFPGIVSPHLREMTLRPLGRRAIERLVKGVLGPSIEPAAVERIVKLSEGNALFLEELIRAAAEGKTSEAPETVIAILQARLSNLSAPERRILRAASIVGETFWVGAVRDIMAAWSAGDDAKGWLEQLVEEEIVERHKQGRFYREIEMGFRHALVRDAAYGLLTEADLRSGHRAASAWLESAGEPDAMALAAHALLGGELARAARFYANAAAESLGRNDLQEAAQRARKGLDCGAEGEGALRGELLAIHAVAKYGLGVWPEAAEAGLRALALLPEGSFWWCRTAERMIHALPQVGDTEHFIELARDTSRVEPTEGSWGVLCCALANLFAILSLMGPRELLPACRDALAKAEACVAPSDLVSRGTALKWRAITMATTEPRPFTAFKLAAQAARVLSRGQVYHELCMACVFEGVTRRALGDLAGAEEKCRAGLAIAEKIQYTYQIANARLHLAEALVERADDAAMAEAEELARCVVSANVGLLYKASAWRVLADVALHFGQREIACEAGRKSVDLAGDISGVLYFQYAATFLRALVESHRIDEAMALVTRGMETLARFEGGGHMEIPFRLAAAETFFAAGDQESAKDALRVTLRRLDLRLEDIEGAEARERYLAKRENVRVFALSREWLERAP